MKHKRWMMIACICIILGAMFIGAGFGLGGELHDVYGVHFGIGRRNESRSTGNTETKELTEFKTLTMDISIGDIIIKRGSSLSLAVKNVPNDEYDIKQHGDTLTITSNPDNSWFRFSLDRLEYEFVLTIPEDFKLEQIDLTSSMGDVEISHVALQKLTVNQHMGDIDLTDVHSEQMVLDQDMGDVTYKGSHPGSMQVDNSMGDIELAIQDQSTNYRYDCSTSMGSIKVNNQHQDGFSEEVSGGSKDAPYVLTLDNSMGDIEVSFDD